MKKYLKTIKLSIIDENAFKMNYYLSFISIPIQIFIIYFFWQKGLGTSEIKGFNLTSIILYFIFMKLLQICYQSAMFVTYELWNEINNGTIILWLVRPIFYPIYMLSKKIGIFIIRIISSLFFIHIVLYCLNMNISISKIILGFLSSILGYTILYEIQFLIGSLTFWIKNVLTLRDTIIDVLMLIGGLIIPIDFMPSLIRNISLFTPMPSIYYFPTIILINKAIDILEIYEILFIQGCWITILTILINIAWKLGSCNIEQGS